LGRIDIKANDMPREKVPSEIHRVLQEIRNIEQRLLADFIPKYKLKWEDSMARDGVPSVESIKTVSPRFDEAKANDEDLGLARSRLTSLTSRIMNSTLDSAIDDESESRRRMQAFEIYRAVIRTFYAKQYKSALPRIEHDFKRMQREVRGKQQNITEIISRIGTKPTIPENDVATIIQELEAITISLNGVDTSMARLFWGLSDFLARGLGETHIREPIESRFQEKEPVVWATVQKELITTLTIKKLIRSEQRPTFVHGTETHYMLTDLGSDVLRVLETRGWPKP